MISLSELPASDAFGHPLDDDPRCEGCGRSMLSRFGGPIVNAECPSCEDEFTLLAKAGKIEDGEGNVIEFHFPRIGWSVDH